MYPTSILCTINMPISIYISKTRMLPLTLGRHYLHLVTSHTTAGRSVRRDQCERLRSPLTLVTSHTPTPAVVDVAHDG